MENNDKASEQHKLLLKLAGKIMCDRQALQTLSDRVYELMLEDLRLQKERNKYQ